ncbi:MAG: hypothetical protein KDI54_19780, partial [Gammaproteobacteria bacterium]|nr:hypothetical protein [Gammaproteobacteria bacterium]
HRVSVISVVAVAVALFLLLTKIRFGNSVAALVLAAFVVQMSYFAFVSEAPTSGGPMPRLEYNDEEFGRKYENIAKYVMIVLEVLLVGILLGSKRIRKAYGH